MVKYWPTAKLLPEQSETLTVPAESADKKARNLSRDVSNHRTPYKVRGTGIGLQDPPRLAVLVVTTIGLPQGEKAKTETDQP